MNDIVHGSSKGIHTFLPSSEYCERRYFRIAKFSRTLPLVVYFRGQYFAHLTINSICTIMINFLTCIIFSRTYYTA